jgi:hypothetical protein
VAPLHLLHRMALWALTLKNPVMNRTATATAVISIGTCARQLNLVLNPEALCCAAWSDFRQAFK